MVNVRIVRIPGNDLPLPKYQTAGAAGMDLQACLPGGSVTLVPGQSMLIPTGWRMEIPEGWELQIRSRSGLSLKNQVVVGNSPATIDSDYRGELGVVLHNRGWTSFIVSHGDRVAQAVVAPVHQCQWEEVDTLSETSRGAQGFGSTGVVS